MKKINIILSALVCLFAFSACTDEVGYTPTGATEGVSGAYFSSDEPTSVTLTEDGSAFDITICRTDTVGDLVLNLNVEMDSAAAEVFTVPDTAVFKSGENTSIITVTYDATKLVRGTSYTFVISIAQSDAMNYLNTALSFTAKFPQLSCWKSIGKGKYLDNYFFYSAYEVEIERDSVNPDMYRIKYPYLLGFNTEGYTEEYGIDMEQMGEYLTFRVLRAGESFRDVDITKDGLVVWDIYNTGFVHPSYGDYINIISPASFTSFANESGIAKSCVKVWQESDPWENKGWLGEEYLNGKTNLLPAQIQLAPYYYMMSAGGWNYSTADNQIVITFPGVVLEDYSVGVEYLGRFTDKEDKDHADIGVTFGDDVTSAKVAMGYAGNADPDEVIAALVNGIVDGSVEAVELTASGTARFALGDAGKYVAVAVSYDANGTPQEYQYAEFQYVSANAPEGPETPELDNTGWKVLGMAQYTDDYMTLFDGVEPVTYEVEIQEKDDQSGYYRLVNPYGAAYPYNQAGDWDTSKDYYLEINAVDPQGVYIPTQALGFDWGYGMFYGTSLAAYYMEQGASFDYVKGEGHCGTMVDGVITFPTKGLLLTAPDLGNWYFANTNGAFKVVLPSASKSSKSVKAVANKRVANKTRISGEKLRNMDKKLPVKVSANIR